MLHNYKVKEEQTYAEIERLRDLKIKKDDEIDELKNQIDE